MKTNLITLLAVTAATLVGSRAVAQNTTAAATGVPTEWKSHLVANTPAGLSATGVKWTATAPDAAVEFKVTFRTDAARFRVLPLFPANCPPQVEAVRNSLEAEHKPLFFLRLAVPAGTNIVVGGSFVVRLDGSLSPVVWDERIQGTVLKDAALPLEDSVYVADVRGKTRGAEKKQLMADAKGFARAVGSVSGQVANVTGNPEAAKVAEIARQLGAEGTTNAVPLAGAFQSGAGVLRGLPAVFRK